MARSWKSSWIFRIFPWAISLTDVIKRVLFPSFKILANILVYYIALTFSFHPTNTSLPLASFMSGLSKPIALNSKNWKRNNEKINFNLHYAIHLWIFVVGARITISLSSYHFISFPVSVFPNWSVRISYKNQLAKQWVRERERVSVRQLISKWKAITPDYELRKSSTNSGNRTIHEISNFQLKRKKIVRWEERGKKATRVFCRLSLSLSSLISSYDFSICIVSPLER